ncbi:hypothetical protein EC957_008497 [Mortierella hygrophila]|uniref:Cyanovirin-N domain-containing protein n=1 Tax=Mortierella hygrophila TaxID=979708 RepID=A0A9P6EXI3_9FUNG|nr:hypothetical protein EC957_008497 [Mortierella hygrophila]
MAYRKHVFAHGTVFLAEDYGVWSFADIDGKGAQDLVYIKTRNTGTGKVEIRASDYESRFQKYAMTTTTVFDIDDNGTYLMQDWTGDGKADLVYIQTRNTESGTVEVHVADAASGYKELAFQTDTCFYCEENEENGVWTMSSKGDLVYVKTQNSGSNRIQCHVATKASNYQDLAQHTIPDHASDGNGTWCIAPTCDDDIADLYYINPKNIWDGKVDVHVASVGRGWKNHVIEFPSSFTPEENGRWLMVNFTHQEQPDLAYIKTTNTVSGKVEVHITSPQEVVPLTYILSSQNVKLDFGAPNILRADLKRNDGSWRDALIDLDLFLGNIDGRFTWGTKDFHKSARNVSLDESLLVAELQTKAGSWVPASFELQDNLMNDNGVFRAIDVPVFLSAPADHRDAMLSQLSKAMDDPNFQIRQVVFAPSDKATSDPARFRTQGVMYPRGTAMGPRPVIHENARHDPEGVTTFYANAGVNSSDTVLWTCTADAKASVFHTVQSKGKKIEQVQFDVLGADAGATVGTYLGVDANVSLVKAQASIFDAQLGLGVDTGVGIKDESVQLKVAGCGVTLGRKVAVSVFGTSFGVDFGRLFG